MSTLAFENLTMNEQMERYNNLMDIEWDGEGCDLQAMKEHAFLPEKQYIRPDGIHSSYKEGNNFIVFCLAVAVIGNILYSLSIYIVGKFT